MNTNLKLLVEGFKKDVGSALLSCDLWVTESNISVFSINQNIKYTVTFGKLIKDLEKGLESLGLPGLGKYQITDLEMNTMLVSLNLGNKYVLGCILDKTKIAFGTLLHIAIPNAINNYSKISS